MSKWGLIFYWMTMAAAMLIGWLLAGQVRGADFNDVRLVVGYDDSVASQQMFPTLAKAREAGLDIVYVNLQDEKVRKFLEAFEIDTKKAPPYYVLYIGHEAWEKNNGPMALDSLKNWFARAAKEERTGQATTQQRKYLQEPGSKPIVYLRRTLSAPSCGMAWCVSHRYEILEYVDATGKVVGRPER